MTNKEIWQLWVNEYNETTLWSCVCSCQEDLIEKRFYEPYPEEYRPLINALLSCVKWHKLNRENYNDGSELCGHCYNAYRQGKIDAASNWFTELLCNQYCKLYKKLDENCFRSKSLFRKSSAELEDCPKGPCTNANKLYKALLSIYKEEYEKLFGTSWRKE